jgi:prenyltransferase beta subunit
MDPHCHKLKHDSGFAKVLLAEMEIIQPKRVSKSVLEGFHDAITYFRNHHHQMHYVEAIAANLPIGSGITEAACKVIIKARLCCSGMKWKDRCDRISIK